MKTFERRMAVAGLEVRDESDGLTLTGYASTFGDDYDMGWYTERVEAGAFKRTLGQNPDVRLLINHDGLPLARTTSGTLTLSADKKGLLAEARLDPSDPDVAGLLPKMRRGDLNQMSFGFRVLEDVWEDDMTSRTLRSLDLNGGDVSVVTFPANPNTTVGVRAAGPNAEAVTAALRCLEARDASPDDIAEVLARALAHFNPAARSAAVAAVAEAVVTEPPTPICDDAARQAQLVLELRRKHAALSL